MLLRLIKNNNLFGTLLIPIAAVLFWMNSFQTPSNLDVVSRESVMPLYYLLQELLKSLNFWQITKGFILVLVNSFLIAKLSSSFLLFKKGSSLPGIIYIITISSIKPLQTLHPVHIATFFILAAIYYILSTYHQQRSEISFTFNASFFIALASLFYFPAAALFPLIWISIFVLQKSDNWRLLVVPVMGFSAPWIFTWAVSFMNDSSGKLFSIIKNIIWSDNNAYLLDPIFLSVSALIILLTIMGSISLLSRYQSIKISSRKYFTIFYWMLGLLLITALSFTMVGMEIIALSTIPVAFVISYFFLSGERFFWKELFFFIYIGVMTASFLMQ